MAHYGTLREYRFGADMDDIRGANLYGINDEKLGTIEDVVFDHQTGAVRYIVVDTGGWLSSRKFLVPAARIEPYHRDQNDFYARLDRQRIEQFPPYNQEDVVSEERWRDYEDRYQSSWQDAPVQHREGSTRNITPEAAELPPPTGAGDVAGVSAPDPTRRQSAPEPMGGVGTGPAGIHHGAQDISHEKLSEPVGASTTATRWSRFEEGLRRRRPEIVRECPHCGRGERRVA